MTTQTLSEDDLLDLRRAEKEYQESIGVAIHMSTDHVKNLLRIIKKLRAHERNTH